MPSKESIPPHSGSQLNGPGLRKGRKGTNDEIESRVEQVAGLIAKGLTPSQITEAASKQWGVRSRSVARYLRRARAWMLKAAGADRTELRSRMFTFYGQIMRGSSEKTRDKLQAAAQLCRLMGLDAPVEQRVGGMDGPPIKTDGTLTKRTLLVLPENGFETLRQRINEAGGNKSAGN